jgi:hypothetical protein
MMECDLPFFKGGRARIAVFISWKALAIFPPFGVAVCDDARCAASHVRSRARGEKCQQRKQRSQNPEANIEGADEHDGAAAERIACAAERKLGAMNSEGPTRGMDRN